MHGAWEVDRTGETGVPDPPRGGCRVEISFPDVDAEQHGNAALGEQLLPGEALGQATSFEDRQHTGNGRRAHVAQAPGIDGEQKVRAATFGGQGHAARANRSPDKELPREGHDVSSPPKCVLPSAQSNSGTTVPTKRT